MAHNPPSQGASSSATGNFIASRSSPGNGANPSISGLVQSVQAAARPFQRAGTTDPVWSGDKGMDQSVAMGSLEADPCPARDNRLPPLPPFQHGN